MESKTATKILDVAQDIVRNRGYSAFSYADIAEEVGIRKASIHYHFASKDNLVRSLVKRYRKNMGRDCAWIAASSTRFDVQLMQFTGLYRHGLDKNQICLCAMLSADFAVLPEATQAEIQLFFQEAEAWLVELLQKGCNAGLWECSSSVQVEAKGLIALLQGAQLIARSSNNPFETFDQIIEPLLGAKFSMEF
ncbi:TetR/AcrR family transcriptional regulator [[Limnothrix rosea] IAM M-220]|uniref:TetR/AcrR family transcriptional regulator n=1 Tax=[Limnothrix rosea] IAM M-220 TaxID=454133 RepID=UPI0009659977|nr:TetR/AcrR family transcriptional regulator [[Limnothrix rosea] IAM M-220]OKH18012.1 TetR family transcriptional regulator [[Limnothrix rosea] IAM M-220]